MKLKVLDIFSGIGGFSLGLERTNGFETVAFVEIEPYCRAVLRKHWPHVRQYDDVRTAEFPRADVVVGGFPCQDISGAGKRAGTSGERSGLFRELVRAIRVAGAKYAILENVADLIHRGMGDVLGELAGSGLCIEWDCIPACAIGAPHERNRVWIVAYADERKQPDGAASTLRRGSKSQSKSKSIGAAANGEGKLQPGWPFREIRRRAFYGGSRRMEWAEDWRDRLGALCRVDDGVSRRLGEARCLGNSLIPQIPEMIGHAILAAEGLT